MEKLRHRLWKLAEGMDLWEVHINSIISGDPWDTGAREKEAMSSQQGRPSEQGPIHQMALKGKMLFALVESGVPGPDEKRNWRLRRAVKTEVADGFAVGIQVAKAIRALLVLFVPGLPGWVWGHIWDFSLGHQEAAQTNLLFPPSRYHFLTTCRAGRAIPNPQIDSLLYTDVKTEAFVPTTINTQQPCVGWDGIKVTELNLKINYLKALKRNFMSPFELDMKRMRLLPKESLSTAVRGTEHTSPLLHWVLSVPRQPSFVTRLP